MSASRMATAQRAITVLAALGTVIPSTVLCQNHGDYYVILSSDTTRADAEEKSAAGTWVLETTLYPGLTPNLYAVVRGPFDSLPIAEEVLAFARGSHPDAYIRNAGILPVGQGDSQTLVSTLLGDTLVDVRHEPGGRHGCEPQEAYSESRSTSTAGTARFRVIERTGEVKPVDPCLIEAYRRYLSALDLGDVYSVSRALGFFKWHFMPSGAPSLNDSALVEFRTLYGAVFKQAVDSIDRANGDLLTEIDRVFVPPVGEAFRPIAELELPDTPAARLWTVIADNGFSVGAPGRSAPGFSPGRSVVENAEYLPSVFGDYVTDGMAEYLRVRREEQRVLISGGRYSFDLGHPLVVWERFLDANPEFVWRSEAASYYRDRLEPYFVGSYRGAPVFNWDDGTVELAQVYERFGELYPDTETAKLFGRYYEVVLAGDLKCTAELEDFLHNINLADLVVGGRPLFPREAREAILFPFENLGGAVYIECSPDENGNIVRDGTLPDGRRYTIEEARQGDNRERKVWLVCHATEVAADPKRSPLLHYSIDPDELEVWARELTESQIAALAERYCK